MTLSEKSRIVSELENLLNNAQYTPGNGYHVKKKALSRINKLLEEIKSDKILRKCRK